jgi:hypothetical protein
MSDQRLRTDLDGAGGGFGKFKGLSVKELADMFERQLSEPNMRSVSAVLRISREQVESRGSITVAPAMAAFTGVFAVGTGIAMVVASEQSRAMVLRAFIACLLTFLAFLYGWLSNRHVLAASLAQERAIRQLAIESLTRVVEDPAFKPKALDYDQKRILRELIKKTKNRNPAVAALLQD